MIFRTAVGPPASPAANCWSFSTHYDVTVRDLLSCYATATGQLRAFYDIATCQFTTTLRLVYGDATAILRSRYGLFTIALRRVYDGCGLCSYRDGRGTPRDLLSLYKALFSL